MYVVCSALLGWSTRLSTIWRSGVGPLPLSWHGGQLDNPDYFIFKNLLPCPLILVSMPVVYVLVLKEMGKCIYLPFSGSCCHGNTATVHLPKSYRQDQITCLPEPISSTKHWEEIARTDNPASSRTGMFLTTSLSLSPTPSCSYFHRGGYLLCQPESDVLCSSGLFKNDKLWFYVIA